MKNNDRLAVMRIDMDGVKAFLDSRNEVAKILE